ncbi:LysE family translocator [Shewanella sp. AS16]|uniref:LysE family translocator n=1 Tax=Shewanella sp. AS16 TaxID=2907625 RepID=UPI001F245B2D|nr:LysE family translocator [Shewanella sp. AS16]MCE9686343.1 LysE family translocator [Shewanella sp. AS16]
MFGTQDLLLFIVSGLLLNMTPGPDSLLIMARSASQGWRAGSAAALGIGAGTCIHILAAALGLSAILATSTWAFTLVKFIGAAYLLYVGVALLLSKRKPGNAGATEAPVHLLALSYRRIFVQGFFTNVLNPKVALFFLAFVPQFIAPEAPDKALAFILLGAIFNFNGMLWCHFLAISASFASRKIKASTAMGHWLNRSVGVVFVSFGIKLALSDRS